MSEKNTFSQSIFIFKPVILKENQPILSFKESEQAKSYHFLFKECKTLNLSTLTVNVKNSKFFKIDYLITDQILQ